MMVMCYASAIIEHDGRRPQLPSAPAVMKHENNRTEQPTSIALNTQHNP